MNKPALPILDVDDADARFRSLRETAAHIRDGLVFLGLEYTNKITGKLVGAGNENYFRLRDTILYRLDSLVFHLNLLLAVRRSHLGQLAKSPYDSEQRHRLLLDGTWQQVQLFDSIVFHSISLFDYLGNLIDYIAGGKGQMRLKWPGVIKSVNDQTNLLSQSPIAPVVLKLHKNLVDRLYLHRSDLIHYSADVGGAQTTLDLMKGTSNFVVFGSKKIVQRFPELKELSEANRITLVYVAFWVCEKTVQAARDLVPALLQHIDIYRKTPKGSGVFFFGDPRKGQMPKADKSSDSNPKTTQPTNEKPKSSEKP